MKNKIFTLLLICTTSCLSASDKIEFPDQTTAHTLAVQKYADFLENTSFYAFVPADFQDTPTDTTQHSKIYPVSLYQRYQKLPDTLQEHIASYLPPYYENKRYEHDVYLNLFRADLDDLIIYNRYQNKDQFYYKHVSERLRIEYWQRFLSHAQKTYPLLTNQRMKPSNVCLNRNNTKFTSSQHPINKIINNNLLSETKTIEIMMLLIACGALVTTQNYRLGKFQTPLYFAIQQDNLPLVKFFMQAGITRLENMKYPYPKPLIVHAAENNALQAIMYLHKLGYNLNEQDTDGNTALYKAYYWNKCNAVKLLLKLGADPKTIKSKQGKLYIKQFLRRHKKKSL